MTTLDVFHDWSALSTVYQKATSYDPRFNPPSLEYFTTFDGGHTRLDLLRDLVTRGLLSEKSFANMSTLFNASTGAPIMDGVEPAALAQLSTAFLTKFMGTVFFGVSPSIITQPVEVMSHHFQDPRLLVRLFRISGCSFPDAVSGTTPVTRSPGCACIADTYLRFVKTTANMTSNVTQTARNDASDAIVRCMDRRVTWQAWAAGSVWTIHPVALAFYSSGILFLVSCAYILSYYHYDIFPDEWNSEMRTRAIQGLLVVLTGVMVLILMLHAPLSNALQAVGLVLSLSTFLFSTQGVLRYHIREERTRTPFKPEPHPLTVCFWLNLPLLIPGPLVAVAVGGYTRDLYAVWTIALTGALLGILFMVRLPPLLCFACISLTNSPFFAQRLFWYIWNDDHGLVHITFSSMLLAILDLFLMLVVWFVVYRVQDGGVASMSGIGPILVVTVWLMLTGFILWYEFHVFLLSVAKEPKDPTAERDLNQRFEDGEHASMFFLALGVLVWFTAVACIDSRRD